MQKTLSALALAGTIALLGAGAAQAAEYPAAPVAGVVSAASVAPGETVTFSGAGFEPREAILVTATLNAPDGSASVAGLVEVVASAQGTFVLPVTFEQEGNYTLLALGESGRSVVATVTVTSAAVGGGTPTPGPTAPGGTTPGGTTPGGTTPVVNNNDVVVAPNDGKTVVVAPTDGKTVVITAPQGAGTANTGTTVAAGTTTATKGGLANTGVETSMFLWGAAGIGALGLGAGSIVVARRRAGAEA